LFDTLNEILQFSDKEYYAFELFRTIRNTFHNNGVYTEHNTKEKNRNFPIMTTSNNCKYDMQSKKITYDNRVFYLHYDKIQDFGNSMNLLIQKILPDMLTMLKILIDKVMHIRNEITDPFFNSNLAII
jgi:hypothetical protein